MSAFLTLLPMLLTVPNVVVALASAGVYLLICWLAAPGAGEGGEA